MSACKHKQGKQQQRDGHHTEQLLTQKEEPEAIAAEVAADEDALVDAIQYNFRNLLFPLYFVTAPDIQNTKAEEIK